MMRIGLGLAALGRPGYINLGHSRDLGQDRSPDAMRAHAHEVLDAAWSGGVRWFDAARSYGRAEVFLGSWLAARAIPPEQVRVSSKWGYTYTAGWRVAAPVHEVKEHSLAVLQRQISESRDLLGGHLDLYQIHSATLDSGVLEDEKVIAKLARLRAEGLEIGLSLSGPQQAETLRRAMDVTWEGKRIFDAVQATWNLLERSATDVLAAAHLRGMRVIVKEALANGRLTDRNSALPTVLYAEAHRLGTTPDAVALAAVLAQPWVDLVLSGAATAEQLQSNLAALGVPWDDALAERLEPINEPAEEYWATRSKLPWN